ALEDSEWPEVAEAEVERDSGELEEERRGGQTPIVDVDQAEENRAADDDRSRLPAQDWDSLEIADDDPQREELLDDAPDRIDEKQGQCVHWEREPSLSSGKQGHRRGS